MLNKTKLSIGLFVVAAFAVLLFSGTGKSGLLAPTPALAQQAAPNCVSPVGDSPTNPCIVTTLTPILTLKGPVPGAKGYIFFVYEWDSQANLPVTPPLFSSPFVPSLSYQLPPPQPPSFTGLKSGQTYAWSAIACGDDQCKIKSAESIRQYFVVKSGVFPAGAMPLDNCYWLGDIDVSYHICDGMVVDTVREGAIDSDFTRDINGDRGGFLGNIRMRIINFVREFFGIFRKKDGKDLGTSPLPSPGLCGQFVDDKITFGGQNASKCLVCHASPANPAQGPAQSYNLISVSSNASVTGHANHGNDIAPTQISPLPTSPIADNQLSQYYECRSGGGTASPIPPLPTQPLLTMCSPDPLGLPLDFAFGTPASTLVQDSFGADVFVNVLPTSSSASSPNEYPINVWLQDSFGNYYSYPSPVSVKPANLSSSAYYVPVSFSSFLNFGGPVTAYSVALGACSIGSWVPVSGGSGQQSPYLRRNMGPELRCYPDGVQAQCGAGATCINGECVLNN